MNYRRAEEITQDEIIKEIRKYLLAEKITPNKFSERVGVSQNTIYRILEGESLVIKISTIVKIYKAMGEELK